MGSNATFVDSIVKALAGAGEISAQKMFGEYGIFCDGKMVALVCDDQFFVKVTEAGAEFWGEYEAASPYKGAKHCMLLGEGDLRQKERLAELIRITWAHLPMPVKKSRKC